MEPGIDGLLADFTRELDYFVFARDALQPVMEQLLDALERLIRDAADLIALGEVRHLREAYFEQLSTVRPMLEEWLRVRGSGERLSETVVAMSAAQGERFQALLRRDALISNGRERFDRLQESLQEHLMAATRLLEAR